MKLRNSILFPIIYIFILLFTISSLIIVETTHNRFLKNEINRITNLSNSSTQQMIFSMEYSEQNVLKDLFRSWNNQYSTQQIWFALFSEINSLTITTIPSFDKAELLPLIYSSLENQVESYFIHNADDSIYLLYIEDVSFPNSEGNFHKFIIVEDISNLYQNRAKFYILFGIIGVTVVILFLILSGFLLSEILKPLENLSKATTDLENGHFKTLSEEPSTAYELSALCKNFNNMAHIIENQMKSLDDENNKKQYFINALTHELNTPLTSIIGHSDLLLSAIMPIEKQTDSLLFICEEGKRIRNMIDQLFMLIDDQSLEKTPLSTSGLISETMNIWERETEKQNVGIISDGDQFIVTGNLDLLKVAIGNFIHNGIKAAGSGGTVFIRQNKDNRSLTIWDTGSGVKPDVINLIDTPYYRDISADRERGLGLGISIAKEILEKHGFSFKLIQKQGKGLEICIYF